MRDCLHTIFLQKNAFAPNFADFGVRWQAPTPEVSDITTATSIALGRSHSCARRVARARPAAGTAPGTRARRRPFARAPFLLRPDAFLELQPRLSCAPDLPSSPPPSAPPTPPLPRSASSASEQSLACTVPRSVLVQVSTRYIRLQLCSRETCATVTVCV